MVDDSQHGGGRFESPDTTRVTRTALRDEGDLEEPGDALLLGTTSLPVAGLGCLPQPHVTCDVHVGQARNDAVSAD